MSEPRFTAEAETAFALVMARNPLAKSNSPELQSLLKEVWMNGWIECELHRLRQQVEQS